MMRGFLLCLLCLLACTEMAGQGKHTLKGTVSDADGAPVSNANVQVSEGNKPIAYAFTDEKGSYVLTFSSPKEQVQLSVRHIAFETIHLTVDCKTTRKDIALWKKKTQLREVIVKAPQIAQRGDTLTYRLGTFAGKGDYTLRDAMKRLPGLRLQVRAE